MTLRPILIALSLVAATTSARAELLRWSAALGPEADGAQGSGKVELSFNSATNELAFTAQFAGLSSTTTVAHFHCCTGAPGTGTASVAVDAPSLEVPVGVSAGEWSQTLDLDDANNFGGTFLTNSGGTTEQAIAVLLAGLNDGTAYLNIHSNRFPGGEIRGFPAPVSAPATATLLLLSLAAMRLRRRG